MMMMCWGWNAWIISKYIEGKIDIASMIYRYAYSKKPNEKKGYKLWSYFTSDSLMYIGESWAMGLVYEIVELALINALESRPPLPFLVPFLLCDKIYIQGTTTFDHLEGYVPSHVFYDERTEDVAHLGMLKKSYVESFFKG